MAIYFRQLCVLLLFGSMAAGCRSERPVFVFLSEKGVRSERVMSASVSTEPVAAEVTPAAGMAALVVRPTPARTRHRPVALRPHRWASALPVRGVRARQETPPGALGHHPAERAFLLSGLGVGALGLAANYAALGSASGMALLSMGHYLLLLSAVLLLAWFVFLALRAIKE